jgi:cytochrome P450
MTFEFDPFSSAILENSYPTYEALRDQFPVYRNEHRGFWALSRYGDVRAATRDWQTFSNAAGIDFDDTGAEFGEGVLVETDPPGQTKLRKLFQGNFAPKTVRSLEASIRATTEELVASLAERGHGDLGEELAVTPRGTVRLSRCSARA